MDGGTITGIIQCCLAVISIGVDIFLVFLAANLAKRQEQNKAKDAIENTDNNDQNIKTGDIDKKKKNKARNIINGLKKKNPELKISAVSFVIAIKKLYGGDEEFVVKLLKGAKQLGYLTWNGETLRTSTIITISKEKELVDYFSSRKPG